MDYDDKEYCFRNVRSFCLTLLSSRRASYETLFKYLGGKPPGVDTKALFSCFQKVKDHCPKWDKLSFAGNLLNLPEEGLIKLSQKREAHFVSVKIFESVADHFPEFSKIYGVEVPECWGGESKEKGFDTVLNALLQAALESFTIAAELATLMGEPNDSLFDEAKTTLTELVGPLSHNSDCRALIEEFDALQLRLMHSEAQKYLLTAHLLPHLKSFALAQ